MRPKTLTKVITLTPVVVGAVTGASPAPSHNHQHNHAVRRSEIYTTVETDVPAQKYILDGTIVSKNEVCEGIEDGNLQLKYPADGPLDCSSSGAGTTKEPAETSTAAEVTPPQPSVAVQQKQVVKATPTQSSQVPESSVEQDSSTPLQSSTATSGPLTLATLSDSAPSVTFSAAEPSSGAEPPSTETPSLQSGTIPVGQGLEREFPDGEIDCSTFPSEYGPIEIDWANLGGWSGIQYITVEEGGVTRIDTAVPGGKGCIPGAMCSYACPPGYQKSQWPSTQGTTGQSIGGIQCNANGKLSLTNPNLSKTLCIKGTGAIHVQNKLSSNAAICRTDYPGL